MLPCEDDFTTFFGKLQQAKGLDLRDNRGKRHDLAVVLTEVVIALLSNRDGNLSSIHRHLTKHHGKLLEQLNQPFTPPVSRAQLPVMLSKVAIEKLNQLIFEQSGFQLNEEERKWFAIDGKELRGSIENGNRRGEAVVTAVSHQAAEISSQRYYNGEKESEIPVVRELLKEGGLENQKISLDALHCNPTTLQAINQSKGIYLVGLKENQAELFNECVLATQWLPAAFAGRQTEKGHGRIESRQYQGFDIREIYLDQRWSECGIARLLEVSRQRIETKSGRESRQTSYYLSNQAGKRGRELCQAVRKHWQVETSNWIRDCTFQEDSFRTKKSVSHKQCQSCEH